jgi:hypothetical protein
MIKLRSPLGLRVGELEQPATGTQHAEHAREADLERFRRRAVDQCGGKVPAPGAWCRTRTRRTSFSARGLGGNRGHATGVERVEACVLGYQDNICQR